MIRETRFSPDINIINSKSELGKRTRYVRDIAAAILTTTLMLVLPNQALASSEEGSESPITMNDEQNESQEIQPKNQDEPLSDQSAITEAETDPSIMVDDQPSTTVEDGDDSDQPNSDVIEEGETDFGVSDISYSFYKECLEGQNIEATAFYSINVVNNSDETYTGILQPHGGPDPDSEEFNPDVVQQIQLAPEEQGSVTAEIPESGFYEFTDTDLYEVTPLEIFGSDVTEGCQVDTGHDQTDTDNDYQDTKTPEVDNGDSEEPQATTDTNTDVTEDTQESTTTLDDENDTVEVQLPETGTDIALMLKLGLIGSLTLSLGGAMVRYTNSK